jgi:hypothetical protein
MRQLKLILIWLVITIEGLCCECLPLSFDQEVKRSELIFHGRAIEADDYIFTFEIIELWKGNFDSKKIKIIQGKTSCEKRTFTLGGDYVVYLDGTSVGNCSRTAEYSLSVDPEKLDLIFRNIGDKKSIESDKLTTREFTVLKNILDKVKINYPDNLSDFKVIYALEESLVDKRTFLENYLWLSYNMELKRIDKEIKNYRGQYEYLLWTGFNSKKSFRALKRNVRKLPNHQQSA